MDGTASDTKGQEVPQAVLPPLATGDQLDSEQPPVPQLQPNASPQYPPHVLPPTGLPSMSPVLYTHPQHPIGTTRRQNYNCL